MSSPNHACSSKSRRLGFIAVLAGLALAGCSSPDAPKTDKSESTATSSRATHAESKTTTSRAPKPDGKVTRENVIFKVDGGARLYEIKFKADGAKLVDPDEREIARFNVDGHKLKVKLPDDSVVAYVVAKPSEFQIRDASQENKLFELKAQDDGDWKLKDADDGVLAVIKKRDYGFEIEDGAEKSLAKSKLKDGKRSLRDADDRTLLYTKGDFPPISVACLGLDQIDSLQVRAGLAVAVLLLKTDVNH